MTPSWQEKFKSVISIGSPGVSNQVISSLTNFCYGLYLLRNLTPTEFGIYNIGFAFMLFLGGFSQGFFLIQMVVHSPRKSAEERRPYAERVLLLLLCACLALLIFSLLAFWGLSSMNSELAELVFLVALMAIGYTIKEFYTRHAFNESKGGRAVSIHVVVAGLLLLGLGASLLLDIRVTPVLAFSLYAGAHLGAAAFGHAMAGMPMKGHSISALRTVLAEIAAGGKWGAMTNVVYCLRGQAHTIVVAATIGPVGVAKMNAARMLVTPATLLIPAMSQVLLPRIAEATERDGRRGATRWMKKTGLGLTLIAFAYALVLTAVYPYLSSVILGSKYEGLFAVVVLWCVFTGLLGLRNSVEWAAQAMKMFRPLTIISGLCAIVALGAAWALSSHQGIQGAVLGVIIGEITMTVGVFLLVLRSGGGGCVARS